MSAKSKKIGVLLGGLSKERDVSLRSGRAVAAALRAKGYDVAEIDAGRDLPEKLKAAGVQVAFIALHGRYGEDGTVQGLLEIMGIPYTGSGPLASAIGMDKELTKKVLVSEMGDEIMTPVWKIATRSDAGAVAARFLPLPVVVKPNREGSTIGISIVRDEKEFAPAVAQALALDETVLVEEFITGTEVTVSMVNGRALPVVEIVPKSGFYDYASKYTKGATDYIVPARIPDSLRDRLQKTSERIWKVLKLAGFARMDFILEGEHEVHPYFLEVNTVPGMTETSLVPKAAAAAGISFEDLCEEILKGAGLKI
ncbi:MAG TPA: D-alanine--D-alanine ligase [bacterium]|nr:D-alanine--D-alanine ligase [bacterium]